MPKIHDKFMTESGRREGQGAMEKEVNQPATLDRVGKEKPRQSW